MIPEQVRETAAKIAQDRAGDPDEHGDDARWDVCMSIASDIRAMPIPPAPVPADVAGLVWSLRYASRDPETGDDLYPGTFAHLSVEDALAAADAIEAQARQIAAPVADHPKVRALIEALKPLVAIADAFDANELDDEARKFWGQHSVNTTPHENIELYAGRGGKELLTLADCMAARVALRALEEGK
jgi:hypothetical protein